MNHNKVIIATVPTITGGDIAHAILFLWIAKE